MHRLKFKDSINNVIEAQVEGVQCSLFNLTYGTPGFSFILGWYRSVDARSFTILHAQLPIELPQLAIVSQKTAFGVPKGIGGILRYDSSCSIPLPHGDAINYELYVPAGLTRYAEQMISLDLCNILNAANVTLELEIVGRDLFILANHALYDRQEVMELLQSLAPLVKRVANTKFELSAYDAEARLQYS